MVYRQTPRSEKVRGATRDAIRRAARKLFSQHGYDSTTMQDIVREAGTSIGNAYFYFANKEAILSDLVEEAFLGAWAQADVACESVEQGPARIAVAIYANLINFLVNDRDMARIVVTSVPTVLRHVLELHAERLNRLFLANFPDRSEKELLLSSAAVGGANRWVIELTLSGKLNVPAPELGAFMIRWHLRALRCSEKEIDRVVRIATRTLTPAKVGKRAS